MRRFIISAALFLQSFSFADPGVLIFPSPHELGEVAARKIANLIMEKQKEGKKVVLGLATGSTPIPVYSAFRKIAQEERLDLSQVITFNLDEYEGIPDSDSHSFRSFMFSH